MTQRGHISEYEKFTQLASVFKSQQLEHTHTSSSTSKKTQNVSQSFGGGSEVALLPEEHLLIRYYNIKRIASNFYCEALFKDMQSTDIAGRGQ